MEKTINTLHICDKNTKSQMVSNQNTHPKKHVKKLKLQMVYNWTLIQKWGGLHESKSLWDIKSEILSPHPNDFTYLKLCHYNVII